MLIDIINQLKEIRKQSNDPSTNARLDGIVNALLTKSDAPLKNEEADKLSIELNKATAQLSVLSTRSAADANKVKELEKQLANEQSEKQKVQQELTNLRNAKAATPMPPSCDQANRSQSGKAYNLVPGSDALRVVASS